MSQKSSVTDKDKKRSAKNGKKAKPPLTRQTLL
jgi:hypothetical protein